MYTNLFVTLKKSIVREILYSECQLYALNNKYESLIK